MKNWLKLEDVVQEFEEILKTSKKPHYFLFEFKPLLEKSLRENPELQKECLQSGGLLHWNQRTRELNQVWTIEDVGMSLEKIRAYLASGNGNTGQIATKLVQKMNMHTIVGNQIPTNNSRGFVSSPPIPKPRLSLNIDRLISQGPNSGLQTDFRYSELSPTVYSLREKNLSKDIGNVEPVAQKRQRPVLLRQKLSIQPEKLITVASQIPSNLKFTIKEFFMMSELIPAPVYKCSESDISEKCLPYILQQLKFLDGRILEDDRLEELIELEPKDLETEDYGIFNFNPHRSMTPQPSVEENKNNRISTWRLWSLLIQYCNPILIRILLKIASAYERAVPVYCENTSLFQFFDRCSIKWYNPALKAVMSSPYFGDSYKILAFLEIGETNGADTVGKDAFLNKIFKQKVFSENIGSLSPVYAEVSYLSKDTVHSVVWDIFVKHYYKNKKGGNELIYLVNFHGEISPFKEMFKQIANSQGAFVTFLSEGYSNEMIAELKDTVNYNAVTNLNIGFATGNSDLMYDSDNLHQIPHKLSVEFAGQFIMGAAATLKYNKLNHSTINTSAAVECAEVQAICGKLFSSKSEPKLMFVLQQCPKFNYKKYMRLWEENENCRQIMDGFANILNLPLPKREKAMIHLESEINRRNMSITNQVEQKIITADDNEKLNFGIEHLFRELAHLYEMMKFESKGGTPKPDNYVIYSSLAENFAELVINGMNVEILDGNLGRISRFWFEEVCDAISVRCPNIRIYVISILGLQSTGKSTILNSLFGCDFAVSIGKCTKGLFMKLIFIDEPLRAKLGVDAIIVLDTEGLGSDEDMSSDCSKKDRRMATLAMSISNLTLINTFGESQQFIINILQIVIITMARLEKADQVPDILLLRHVPWDSRLLDRGIAQCIKALKTAIDIVETRGEEIGVKQSKSLINLENRLKSGDVFIPIRPFKGTGIGEPPSREYHEDIVSLYNRIISQIHSIPTNNILFASWYQFIDSYWDAIQEQDFITQFQSIKHIQEHFEVGNRISEINQWVDAAFRNHVAIIEAEVQYQISEIQYASNDNDDTLIQNKVYRKIEELSQIPFKCDRFSGTSEKLDASCDECQRVVALVENLLEFQKHKFSSIKENHLDGINFYIVQARDYFKMQLLKQFDTASQLLGKVDEFQQYIDAVMADLPKSSEFKNEHSPEELWETACILVRLNFKPEDISGKIIKDLINAYEPMEIDHEYWKQSFQTMNEQSTPTAVAELCDSPAKRDDNLFNLVKSLIADSKDKRKFNKRLEKSQLEWLESEINLIPRKIMVEIKAKCYEPAMCNRLKESVRVVLDCLERKFDIKLLMKFRRDVHHFGAKKFFGFMLQFEQERRKKLEPYYIFLERKEIYITKITTILNYKATIEEMEDTGSRIADLICKVIVLRVVEKSHRSRLNYIYRLNWIGRPEKIRLMYIQYLVNEIENGNHLLVAKKFLDPKESLRAWYYDLLDSKFDKEYKRLAQHHYDDEINLVTEKVENAQTMPDLRAIVGFYLDQEQMNLLFLQILMDDMEMFKKLQREISLFLTRRRTAWSRELKLPDIRDSKLLDQTLGCIASCPWCGGICWCTSGHNTISSLTLGKHFTCHQPQGLVGIFDKESGELVPGSCDQLYGKNNKLENLYGDEIDEDFFWLFDRHPKSEYNLIMKWIFLQINSESAKLFECKPASRKTFEDYAYDSNTLMENFDSMLSNLRRQCGMN